MAYDSCIQLDRQGRPHIAFSNYGWLRYASWTGSRWEIQTVDNSAWIEWYISLALDGSDAPHISYFAVGAQTSQLRYAEWAGGAWRRQVVDEAVWLGEFNSLALDSTGAPHISYLDVTHSQLKYAHRNGRLGDHRAGDGALVGRLHLDRGGQPGSSPHHLRRPARGRALRPRCGRRVAD